MSAVLELGPDDARRFLVHHLALSRSAAKGAAGVRAVLERLGAIQLDPLDAIGTNADLVAMARVPGLPRGGVHEALMPGHAFEHFAKERCLLPARAFPYYRDRMVETPWWRTSERRARVDPGVLRAVEDEVRARGPITAGELADHGRVTPLDWSGWKGTSSAAKMALEILWTRCAVVVCGRRGRDKLYDVPERALPMHHAAPCTEDFGSWAITERVASAGLLAESTNPSWSMVREHRKGPVLAALIESGCIVRVRVAGKSATYLAPPAVGERPRARIDARMRILGPLDPLLWDRALVRHVFGFDYVWEVYKPAKQRRWGWYVCPLLHGGALVGRIEARIDRGALVVERLWREASVELDRGALDRCLEAHAEACGAERVRWSRRAARA
jgi:uncharacterized protein YcaQ